MENKLIRYMKYKPQGDSRTTKERSSMWWRCGETSGNVAYTSIVRAGLKCDVF